MMALIRTIPFREQEAHYGGYRRFKLLEPSRDSAALRLGAPAVLQVNERLGLNYTKAGVMLIDLSSASRYEYSLDLGHEHDTSRGRLMSAINALIDGVDGIL
jgi:hypothetical protein